MIPLAADGTPVGDGNRTTDSTDSTDTTDSTDITDATHATHAHAGRSADATDATDATAAQSHERPELAPGIRVELPRYDPDRLTPSVVHIGIGAFHRAHQAVYFDELASTGETGWGVVGVGVHSRVLADLLAAQGNLFTVVAREADTATARVIGAFVDVLVLADESDGVRRRLADGSTRLVTLTITGDGYSYDDDTLQSGDSVFRVIVDALDDRRRAGLPPFTVLSCDNLPDSGGAARAATLAFAERRSTELRAWIEQHATFPASMVDRITPETTDEDRSWVAEEFAVTDNAPVMTEDFSMWVVEDAFCNGRPPLDRVGVRFVADVGRYRLIKSRTLNGAHCALGYVGYLAGYRTTEEAMADALVAEYLDRLLGAEIAPLLPGDVAGMDLDEWRQVVLDRVANPAIADPLARLCRRGTTKMGDYLLPSLREARERNRPHALLLVAVAAWLRYARGTDLAGAPIDVVDPRSEILEEAARQPVDEGIAMLLERLDAFDGLRDDALTAQLVRLVRALDTDGVLGLLANLLHEAAAS
jgi:mannitol-1-phosphate/altronate dehydrogenase